MCGCKERREAIISVLEARQADVRDAISALKRFLRPPQPLIDAAKRAQEALDAERIVQH